LTRADDNGNRIRMCKARQGILGDPCYHKTILSLNMQIVN
jgi:hypothetical protein